MVKITILSKTIKANKPPDIQGFIQAMIKLGIKVKVTISVPEEKEEGG